MSANQILTIAGPGAVLLGLVRDNADRVLQTLGRLESVGKLFGGFVFVILHNDSSDRTLAVLRDWSSNRKDRVVFDFPGLIDTYPVRTERLAFLRNAGLSMAREYRQANKDIEYLAVADLDGVNEDIVTGPELNAALSTAPQGWAGIFANQRGPYYDIWALRHEQWCPSDCWREVKDRPFYRSERRAIKTLVRWRQVRIPAHESPIEVDSAFGGFGLYAFRAIENCWYRGLDDLGQEVCEHVWLNRQIRKAGGRLYILPSLLNSTAPDHVDSYDSGKNWRPWQTK